MTNCKKQTRASRYRGKNIQFFALLVSLFSVPISGFEIDGSKWIGGSTEIYLDISGVSATGILWNTAFEDAMDEWTQKTAFEFVLREEYLDPCIVDNRNGVDFTDDVCGTEYSAGTLAVTIKRSIGQILGPASIIESDIIINNNRNFDIYDGNHSQFGIDFAGTDLRRIALHELGHALGLSHENDIPTIMASEISNLDRLTEDDIDAADKLYSGLSECFIANLRFGTTSNSLQEGDCTVVKMTVGSSDTSFIDIYQFELSAAATINVDMTSSDLDSVLLLADSDLRYLEYDDKSSGLCNSTLSGDLPAGSYLLLANTYDVPPKTECGNTGGYQLTASFTSSDVQSLSNTSSLLGGVSNASFSGGITADGGNSFGNSFKASDSLDISAQINVDPLHQGEAGFLVVGAIIAGQILLLNEQGEFIPASEESEAITRASSKTLQAIENIEIVSGLVPAELGIDSVSVDFVVGYGLNSAPGEVYYHASPMNLLISP